MESIDDFCFCNLGSSSTLRRKRLVGVPEKRVEASAESHRSDGRRRMETWPEPCQITTTFRPLYLYLPLYLLILILVFVCIKESGGCSTSLTSEEARRGLAAMVQGVVSAAVVQGGLVAVTVVVVRRREHDL